MSDYSIVHVVFGESGRAYEAMSDLRHSAAEGRVVLDAAVIMEREPDGHLHVADPGDARSGEGALTGSLVGALIGVLAGPLGMLLGAGGGLVGGALLDSRRLDHADSLLSRMSQDVAPGQTVIAAEVHEVAHEVVDGIMAAHGGEVRRYDALEVVASLEVAEEAAETARREAERVLREERRAERKKSLEERVAAVKARFGRD